MIRLVALLLASIMAASGCASRPATASGSLVRFSQDPTLPTPPRQDLDERAVIEITEFERFLALQAPEGVSVDPVLGPGDRVRVMVANGEVFSGIFEVGQSGQVHLPFLPPLKVSGETVTAAQQRLSGALVQAGHFPPTMVRVSVQPRYWAPVEVAVAGAVFDPGVVRLSGRAAEERATYDEVSAGDAGADRSVSNALRAAGGVRPDADLARVVLMRGDSVSVLDLRGLVNGSAHDEAILARGDRIVVPSSGRLDLSLATLSRVTPPGIRVFLSNLTVPADSNTESAVNEHATKLPYGSRLSHALFSANCVGGTKSVNANRVAVLVGMDLIAGELRFMEVPVEEVIRNPASAVLNPALLPNDAVGCYDSRTWNLRDLARTASDLLNPLRVLSETVRGPRY